MITTAGQGDERVEFDTAAGQWLPTRPVFILCRRACRGQQRGGRSRLSRLAIVVHIADG